MGGNLASTRLGEKTRLAAAALVIGANLPDLDAILYFTGHDDLARGFRRGWTHGILAIVVLPLLLTGVLLLYDRLRPSPRRASGRWLLALSVLAVLTHPFLDWLNTYGMRWLMPFDGRWFYGDSVYIMDPLLWLVLGVGWLAGRRPNWRLVALWAFFAGWIARIVGARSSEYLPLIAAIAVVMLLALLWTPKNDRSSMRAFATAALAIGALYVGGRIALNEATESAAQRELESRGVAPVERIMASPHPLNPLRWDVVTESRGTYRYGRWDWRTRRLELAEESVPVAQDSPEWRIARSAPEIAGFMTWIRFPWYSVEQTPSETRIRVHDARRLRIDQPPGDSGGELVVVPR